MKKTYLLLPVLILMLFSCEEKEKKVYKLPDNVLKLIAGDSLKTWKIVTRHNGKTRMNMGQCFMAYRQTFKTDSAFYDNNDKNENCGPSLRGNWKVLTLKTGEHFLKLESAQLPELLGTKEDYKYFKILYLSKDTLQLAFSHIQYGNKKRIIRDLMVREDLDVGDRSFHH